MAYRAITSQTPPASQGSSKKLWSPDLFDTATGAYPKTTAPASVAYPMDGSGKFSFFESSAPVLGRVWPTSDSGGGSDAYSAADKALGDITTDATYAESYAEGASSPVARTWSWSGASGTMSGALCLQLSGGRFDEWGTAGAENQDFASASSELHAEFSTDGGATWDSFPLTWTHAKTGNFQNGTETFTLAKQVAQVSLAGVNIAQVRVRVRAVSQTVTVGAMTATSWARIDAYTIFLDQTA